MISCVVFDFDGTLVDSNDVKRQAFFEIASSHPGGGVQWMGQALDSEAGDRKAVFHAYVQRMAEAGTSLDADQRGGSYGAINMLRSLGWTVTPFLAVPLYTANLAIPYAITAVLSIADAVILYVVFRGIVPE